MDNLLARVGQLISPVGRGFMKLMRDKRGEVVVPFLETVAEPQRAAVTSFVNNSGATPEDLANFKTYDEFLTGYKPKVPEPVDWTKDIPEEHKAVVGVKGWKNPGDVVKSYAEIEKLVGHDKIAMPKKDKDGNYDPADFERVMTQLGRPKDPTAYTRPKDFKLPDGININEALENEFKVGAHKVGLLPNQYSFVMTELGKLLGNASQAMTEKEKKDANEAVVNLRSQYGITYDEKVNFSNKMLKNFSDPKDADQVVAKYGNDPVIIKLLSNIGEKFGEEKFSIDFQSGGLLTPEQADAKIKEVKNDPKHPYFNEQHPEHAFWLQKMSEWYRMLG